MSEDHDQKHQRPPSPLYFLPLPTLRVKNKICLGISFLTGHRAHQWSVRAMKSALSGPSLPWMTYPTPHPLRFVPRVCVNSIPPPRNPTKSVRSECQRPDRTLLAYTVQVFDMVQNTFFFSNPPITHHIAGRSSRICWFLRFIYFSH